MEDTGTVTRVISRATAGEGRHLEGYRREPMVKGILIVLLTVMAAAMLASWVWPRNRVPLVQISARGLVRINFNREAREIERRGS